MSEPDVLKELSELRVRVEALHQAGEPFDSLEMQRLRTRHADLLAMVNEQTIVPVAWDDNWSP